MNQEMKMDTRIFKYTGGKGRMSEALVSCIPDSCNNYAEPFCGSAAVALATLKCSLNQRLLNDLDPYIAAFWKVASDPCLGEKLLEQLQVTRHDRGAFQMALERRRAYGVNMDPVLMSRDTYLLIQQSFNGKGTHWVADGRTAYNNKLQKLPALFEQIRGKFVVENMDAVDFMESHDLLGRPEYFIYIDSPYLEGLRCDGALYAYDMPDAAEHIRLLRAIQNAQAKIIVSGYWSGSREEDLYDFYLCQQSPEWHRSLLGAYSKKILRENGLPEDLNVHSLRHTNASLLIAQGVDVRTVAGLLGHAQPSTTLDIYSHAFDKNKRAAQEKLGKVLGV